MVNVKGIVKNGKLYICLMGHIDSGNAAGTEAEVFALK